MTRRRDRWFPHRLPQRDRAACVDAVVDHDVRLAVACMENTRQGGHASPRRAPRRQHHKIIARGSPGCSSVNIMWTDVEQRPKVRSRLPRRLGNIHAAVGCRERPWIHRSAARHRRTGRAREPSSTRSKCSPSRLRETPRLREPPTRPRTRGDVRTAPPVEEKKTASLASAA